MKIWNFFNEAIIEYAKDNKTQDLGDDRKEIFVKKLYSAFKEAKVFRLDEGVDMAIQNTDGNKDLNYMPYDKIFLEVNLDVSDLSEKQFGKKILKVVGMLVVKMNFVGTPKGVEISDFSEIESKILGVDCKGDMIGVEGKGVMIIPLCFDEAGGFSFNSYKIVNDLDIFDNEAGEHFNAVRQICEQPKIKNRCVNYVSNFLDLINSPKEITMIEKEYSIAKNKQRKRKGKLKVPKITTLLPVGELKRYIGECSRCGYKLGHKFDVRGHKRRLKHERYKVKRTIWVYPYEKGSGIKVNKTYEVVENE